MLNPQPKPVTYRNKDYLAWIRGKPCIYNIDGIPGFIKCGKPSVPCHVRRRYAGAGIAHKPHDYFAIPMCVEHNTYENEREYGTDRQIIELLMEYIESKRKK